MATLQDILEQNRKKELNRLPTGELAESVGQVQTPADPLSVAALPGATPKQVDMAGSPLQVAAAETDLLSTAVRRRTPSGPPPAYAVPPVPPSALGNLQDRVASFINAQKKSLQDATATTTVGAVPVAPTPTIPPGTDLISLKTALTNLKSNPKDVTLQAAVNAALGRGPTNLVTAEELGSLYTMTLDGIASGVAGNIDTILTVSDLAMQPEFGMTLDQLGQLFGMSADQVGALSVMQLRAEIQKLQTGQTAGAEATAISPLAGVAERGEAREISRELEESGVATAERTIESLAEAVGRADVVSIGGKDLTVEQVLGDEGFSRWLTEYVAADPESRKQLAKEEPELSVFAETHLAALTALSSDLAVGAKSLAELQKQSVSDIFSAEVMGALVPGGILTSTVSSPVFTFANTLSDADKKAFGQNINNLVAGDPNFLDSLKGAIKAGTLTDAQLRRFSGSGGARAVTDYFEGIRQSKIVDSLTSDDLDELVDYYFGDSITSANVGTVLADETKRATLGLPTSGILDVLDKNRNGKVDPEVGQTLLDKIRAGTSAPTLAAAGKTYSPVEISSPALSSSEQALLTSLGAAAADGTIYAEEVKGAGLSDDLVFDLLDSKLYQTNAGVRRGIDSLVFSARKRNTDTFLSEHQFASITSINKSDRTAVQNLLDQTILQMASLQESRKMLDQRRIDPIAVEQALWQFDSQIGKLTKLLSKWEEVGPGQSEEEQLKSGSRGRKTIPNPQALMIPPSTGRQTSTPVSGTRAPNVRRTHTIGSSLIPKVK